MGKIERRGGPRPGAGRPAKPPALRRESFCVQLTAAQKARAEAYRQWRGLRSLSAAVVELMGRGLDHARDRDGVDF